jgi:hypothetical protein
MLVAAQENRQGRIGMACPAAGHRRRLQLSVAALPHGQASPARGGCFGASISIASAGVVVLSVTG